MFRASQQRMNERPRPRPHSPSLIQENKANSNFVILDVRTPEEFQEGHIEGAVNIPHTEIREKISGVTKDKGQIIVLYCRSGRRSNLAMQTLRDLGYKNAYNAGGYDELLKQKPN